MVTAMVAIAMLKQNPGSAICYNLICSASVPEIIAQYGGRPIRTPVGHSLIKKIMRDEDAIFGGEHSGHFYFRDNWYADSGMIALLTILKLISESGQSLSDILRPLDTRVRTGELNFEVADKQGALDRLVAKYEAQGAAIDRLDGITLTFPDWWANIRPSNTEPLLRLNAEANTPELLEEKSKEVMAEIQHFSN